MRITWAAIVVTTVVIIRIIISTCAHSAVWIVTIITTHAIAHSVTHAIRVVSHAVRIVAHRAIITTHAIWVITIIATIRVISVTRTKWIVTHAITTAISYA